MLTIYQQLIAQNVNNPALGPSLGNINGVEFIRGLIPALVGVGFVIGVIIFFFVLLIGAIGWITSGGDKAKAETARGRITNAIIGLVILFSLYAIINLLEIFFATNLVRIDLGPLKIG